MKNKLFPTFILFLVTFSTLAQVKDDEGAAFNFQKKIEPLNRKHQFNLHPYVGFPHMEKIYTEYLAKTDSSVQDLNFSEISVKGLPPLGIGAEFFLNNYFALGVNFLYNKYHVDFIDRYETWDNNTQSLVPVEDVYRLESQRFRFQLKGSLHFKSKSLKLDPYVSLALGMNFRKYNFYENDVPNPEVAAEMKNGIFVLPFSLRTCFGLRYYPIHNLGLNAEVGIGGTLLSLGLVFRFNQIR